MFKTLNEHGNLRCSMQPIYFRGTLVKIGNEHLIRLARLSLLYTYWEKQKTDYFPNSVPTILFHISIKIYFVKCIYIYIYMQIVCVWYTYVYTWHFTFLKNGFGFWWFFFYKITVNITDIYLTVTKSPKFFILPLSWPWNENGLKLSLIWKNLKDKN